jgi:lactate permease
MTGSTTASNALFAGFQQEVARFLGLDPTILLAAQTAGGNVGNAIAPVVILVGLSAVGDADELSGTLRSTLAPIVGLLVLVTAMTWLMLSLA